MEFTNRAIEKLVKEKNTKPKGRHAVAVFDAVAAALTDFVAQDDEFAQAVVQTDKTLADCCEEIMQGVGNSISDINVYKKAVAFYFPGAGVEMQLTIDLCAGVKDGADMPSGHDHVPAVGKNKAVITLDLADFL